MNRFAILIVPFCLWACQETAAPIAENTKPVEEKITIPSPAEKTMEMEPEKRALAMQYVTVKTNKGEMVFELDPNKAPQTVENFLKYVDAKHYDGTIFHRVIPNFMVQGGGFTAAGAQKKTDAPIFLESNNGLKNDVGTIAMARTNAPNSATSQFFINVQNNDFLNYNGGNPGYAVFGKVTTGMDVVNEIRQVKTGNKNGMGDWPIEPVVIESIRRDE